MGEGGRGYGSLFEGAGLALALTAHFLVSCQESSRPAGRSVDRSGEFLSVCLSVSLFPVLVLAAVADSSRRTCAPDENPNLSSGDLQRGKKKKKR